MLLLFDLFNGTLLMGAITLEMLISLIPSSRSLFSCDLSFKIFKRLKFEFEIRVFLIKFMSIAVATLSFTRFGDHQTTDT